MNTAIEIQAEIEALPHQEYLKLVSWFSERDWNIWDKEIEEDSRSGKLDFLISEALEEKSSRKLKEV
jgi:hypothetical protein